MQIYNTLSRSLEEFKPIEKNKIRFYHCGPTVYWVQHIGNMRAMVWADFIRRSLVYLGYDVDFVRNYTDVGHLVSDEDTGEDKMEKGAKREGLTPDEIASKYIGIFNQDIALLNTLPPNHTPRATEYIGQMIDMIKILVEKKHAYITDFAIYFDVSTFLKYNELNKQKMELNKQGLGKGTIDDSQKKHFADFALWFFKKGVHKNALQTWESPWGVGFPGWHIECSAMAKQILGNTIDIKMGGVDHISVHHTNEIAQSESANRVPYCHYWIHNEMLVENNSKMAKSSGKVATLEEVIKKGFDPLDLRYFFMSAHYRSKQNFTWEALKAAREGYINLKKQITHFTRPSVIPTKVGLPCKGIQNKVDPVSLHGMTKEYSNRFKKYISNDFQIPQALALLWEVIKSDLLPNDKLDLILDFDNVFGLKLNDVREDIIPQEIIDLADKRLIAKQQQDYIKADELRQLIEEKGYRIEDMLNSFKVKRL